MDFNETFHDKEYAEAVKLLDEDLKNIEEKYIDVFKERKQEFHNEDRDYLKYHWIMAAQHGRVTFAFNEDSDLPEYIKAECINAFKNRFGPKPE